MKKQQKLQKIAVGAVLLVGTLFVLFPLYITVITAFKRPEESAKDFFGFPSGLYLENFQKIIDSQNFFIYVGNSVLITVLSLAAIIFLIPMVSYSISRNAKNPYFRFLNLYFLAGIFVPFQVTMLPIVKFMSKLSLTNQWGVIILYVTLGVSQGVFLCVAYLKSISMDIEESAQIDGCTVFQTFFKIVFPLMKPIIVTVLIMDALWIWNDFLLPLVMLNRSQTYWTLPLFQYNFKSQYSFDYNLAFASFCLSMLPIIITYFFLQRSIIGGLTDGAVKS